MHKAGGNLAIHLDYSIHPKMNLQRKLNLILYLEEDYDAPLFLQAKKHAGEVVEYVEVTADYNSPVRGYNHYYMGTGFDD